MIIAFVGMAGSGKSVGVEVLVERGFRKVYFGGITLEEVKKRGMEDNANNEKMVREELRKEYGMGAYAVLSLPKIEKFLDEGKDVVIDGLYSWSEYKILKEKFLDKLLVIAVFTPLNLRYERISLRDVRSLSFEEARKRDYAEIENIEKGGPIALADFTVVNDGSVEELRSSILNFVDNFNL